MPPEYIEHFFCREVWHCPPSVFRAQDPVDVLVALTIMGVEADVRAAHTNKRTPTA